METEKRIKVPEDIDEKGVEPSCGRKCPVLSSLCQGTNTVLGRDTVGGDEISGRACHF
jgi:hypothetical protein